MKGVKVAKPWFRLYRALLNDPKVQKLRPELFKHWINILCQTDDAGRLPPLEVLAFSGRTQPKIMKSILDRLVSERLVDIVGDVYFAHNWAKFQYDSDVSTGRVKRFRERYKNVSETPPDTDTDTDTEKKEVVVRVAAPPKSRGTRWPDDAVVSEGWIAEGEAYRDTANLQAIDLRTEALKFANYWASKSGGGATKIDWKRTWLNWCMTAKGTGHGKPNGGKSQLEVLADIARNGLHPDRGQ
jgi:hypothetical protein